MNNGTNFGKIPFKRTQKNRPKIQEISPNLKTISTKALSKTPATKTITLYSNSTKCNSNNNKIKINRKNNLYNSSSNNYNCKNPLRKILTKKNKASNLLYNNNKNKYPHLNNNKINNKMIEYKQNNLTSSRNNNNKQISNSNSYSSMIFKCTILRKKRTIIKLSFSRRRYPAQNRARNSKTRSPVRV